MTALKKYATQTVAVNQKLDSRQIVNNTGGYVYEAATSDRIRRFLVLGTDNGSYYQGEANLTKMNVEFIKQAILANAAEVSQIVREVSRDALAPRNDAAIFVTAMLFAYADDKTLAHLTFSDVVRTPTHVALFLNFLKNFGGRGSAKRKAVRDWLIKLSVDGKLAYQAVKYRQREGWSFRDFLRIARPKYSDINQSVVKFILGSVKFSDDMPSVISAFHAAQVATSVNQVVPLIVENGLPWEAIPTKFLRDPEIWKAISKAGNLKGLALVRNIKRLNEIGAYADPKFRANVVYELEHPKWGVHPANYVNAYLSNKDLPYQIQAAIQNGYHAAFQQIETSDKKILVAIDSSGSMSFFNCAGMNITPKVGASFLALHLIDQFPNCEVVDFDSTLRQSKLRSGMSFDQVKNLYSHTGGATYTSLVFEHAYSRNYDAIVVISDSEANGGQNVQSALNKLRQKQPNIPVAFVNLVSNGYLAIDPLDKRNLSVVGFDTSMFKLISDFMEGRF